MPFIDVTFPQLVDRGSSTSKPGFDTVVITSPSGYEQRIARQTNARRSFSVDLTFADEAEMESLAAFFSLVKGKLNSFRFKDWSDYCLGGTVTGAGFVVGTPVLIGTGNASLTTFQIKKKYTYSGNDVWRNITKPKTGTVKVYLAGVLQTTGYTVNYTTGVVTFTSAPGPGVAVTVACEFDVPARLDTDEPELALETVRSGHVASLPVIEVVE
jgi:uncharacterized protein (TIGR02217 family)